MGILNFSNISLFIVSFIVILRLVIFNLLEFDARYILSDLLINVIILAFSLFFYLHKIIHRQSLKRTPFEWPVLVMLLSAGLSFFYSIDQSITLRSFLNLFSMVIFAHLLVNLLDTSNSHRIFLRVLFVCAVVTSMVAIYDLILIYRIPVSESAQVFEKTHNNMLSTLIATRRASSFFGWPSLLSGYLLLILPFSGLLVIFTKNFRFRLIYFVMFGVILCGFWFTFTFLSWISLFLSALVMFPFFLKNYIRIWTKKAKIIFIGFIALFLILFIFLILHKNLVSSMTPRIIYYQNAITLITKNPFLGYGLGTFGIASKPLVHSINGISEHLHNTYLQWGIEAGILGFIGIVFFIFVFIKELFSKFLKSFNHSNDWIIFSIAWGLLAFFIDNLFNFTFIQPSVAFYSWVMLGVLVAISGEKNEHKGIFKKDKLILLALLASCLSVFYIVLRLCFAFIVCRQGIASYVAGDVIRFNEAIVRSLKLDPWSMKYSEVGARGAIESYLKTQDNRYLKIAESFLLESVRREPAIYTNYYLLSNIYFYLQDNSKYNFYLNKAAQVAPYEFSMDLNEFNKTHKRIF